MAGPPAAAAVAIDLGATSGRVVLGELGPDRLALAELARFPNGGVRVHGALYWDVLGLYRGILDGLRAAAGTGAPVASVGVDTWAVDYGLLDHDGVLLANPLHYRDGRSAQQVAEVLALVPPDRLYARTGTQLQPFNTLFQLLAAKRRGELAAASTFLLLPDLLDYWLSGERRAELTNASTTQLLTVGGGWDLQLAEQLGLPRGIFPPLGTPGSRCGALLGEVARETGLSPSVAVTSVASHDTASAVLAVPAATSFAYVSSGTWSLVGLELEAPVLSEASRAANFTNELGVDGTVRYLRNVTGFILLERCLEAWRLQGSDLQLEETIVEAGRSEPLRSLLDVDDPALLGPEPLPQAAARACRASGQPVPEQPAALVRCLLESLAAAYAGALEQACSLADQEVEVVHLVGGGARNSLLAQSTADACGRPVVAGPVEAATVGNLLVQGRALGVLPQERSELRALVAAQLPLRTYQPRPELAPAWRAARGRLAGAAPLEGPGASAGGPRR